MNPANSRSRLHRTRAPYEGPEYLVILSDHGSRAADGRARVAAAAASAVELWLAGASLESVERSAPFVNEKRRKTLVVTEQLDHRLRWSIGEDPSYELWVYGDNRSCRVDVDGSDVGCDFFVGQAQIARAPALGEVRDAVAAWLIGRVPVTELPAVVPEVELERHAAVLEADPARWHWLHVKDRIDDTSDILAPLAPLLRALAASQVATMFYTYSSLNHLCFSASSHYPWVDQGLPVVAPGSDGSYVVGETRCDLAQALALVENGLRSCSVQPFFGSEPHYELPLLTKLLVQMNSTLRPELVQVGAWFELVVRAVPPNSGRYTTGTLHSVFVDAERRLHVNWPTRMDATRAIRRYCEDGASFDDIAADPRAHRVSLPNRP
jgi:hypothetical protein